MATTTTTHDTGTTLADHAATARAALGALGALVLLTLAAAALALGFEAGTASGLLGALLASAVGLTALVGLPYAAVRAGTALATRTA